MARKKKAARKLPPTAYPYGPCRCIDCGAPLARRSALRCRKHANAANNPSKEGTFNTSSSLRANRLREERRKKERGELERYRSIFANEPGEADGA